MLSNNLLIAAASVMCAAARRHGSSSAEEVIIKGRQWLGYQFKDMRGGGEAEQYIAYFVYIPMVTIFIIALLWKGVPNLKKAWMILTSHKGEIPQSVIDLVDDMGVFDYSMAKLNEFNNRRETKLGTKDLVTIHARLNNRTEFEPDDTFSHLTTCSCIIHYMEYKMQVYDELDNDLIRQFSKVESQVEDVRINRKSIHQVTEKLESKSDKLARELSKAWNLQRKLKWLCLLSILTTGLAIGQIFQFLQLGTRQFVLAPFDNFVLRMCFIGVIILIGIKDLNQVVINMQVKVTGAMMHPDQSRFAMDLYFVRMAVELLAMYTICFMIVTTPKQDPESVVDQTMNFTALVILLQTDNILGAIFQKKIDTFDFNFAYNDIDPATGEKSDKAPEFEFNRAANFLLMRRSKFWILEKCENLLNLFIFLGIFVVFTMTPIFYLMVYIIIPVKH